MFNDNGEYLIEVTRNSPTTGRVAGESGGWVNIADFEEKSYRMNNQLAVRDGNCYSSVYGATIAAGATLYLKQVCTSDIRGISLRATFSGSIDYEQVVGATAGTVLSTLENANIDRRITAQSLNVVQTLSGFTGGRTVDNDFGITATSGSNTASSNVTGAGLGGIFGVGFEPYFKFTNVGSQTARVNLSYVWKEGDI